jgi:membrane protein implicated in regulation of membrane protease activity
MTHWMQWLVLAGVVIVIEMFTGTFYLLMLGIGLLAAALAAYSGASLEWQIATAAVVATAATLALRNRRGAGKTFISAANDPNVNLDIGQSVTIGAWRTVQGRSTARVMYRGAQWDIDLAPGQPALPGLFVIREVRGNRFIVVAASGPA